MWLKNLQYLSTGEPTYWPSDVDKTPDPVDFCVTKGTNTRLTTTTSCLDLTPDHTPFIVTLYAQILIRQTEPSLSNKHTEWNLFRERLDTLVRLDIQLKTVLDTELALES